MPAMAGAVGFEMLTTVIERLTTGPCRIFGLPYGTLRPGAAADVVVFDPAARWTVRAEELVSKGKNSPYLGQTLVGRVVATLFGGEVVYQA